MSMALPAIDYYAVRSLEEASAKMTELGPRAILMSGGTDVIILLKERVLKDVDSVVDIKGIPGLDTLEFEEGRGLRVGANTKLFAIQTSDLVREKMPAVSQAAHYVASAQIRRKGTMAGNICNASPSADTASILLAMNAEVSTYRPGGGRIIPIGEFFKGVKKTCLDKNGGEIVTEILISALKSGEGSAYFKHSVRKAMDLAIIGVAAWIRMDKKTVADVRIAMGGVGITPLRACQAEEFLKGREITEETLEEAGRLAMGEAKPISDVRASAEYRADMVRVYTKRAIKEAVATRKV